jgi:YD repeat-containing protein
MIDPAGKWKQYFSDSFGNLVAVLEPDPAANPLVTQTRTFPYDPATQRLVSATNPENGTVQYTYNADGTLATKTDAKQNKCRLGDRLNSF